MKTTHVAVRPAEAEGKLAAEGPSAFVGEMRHNRTLTVRPQADVLQTRLRLGVPLKVADVLQEH